MEQSELLQFVVEALQQLDVRYAIVGSFASGIWGESRFTQDIDIVIQLSLSNVDQFISHFPTQDFYLSKPAIEEAIKLSRPFNVIHPDSGNKIDFMAVAENNWSQTQLERRVRLELLPGVWGYVASPEDVILGKLTYYREGGSEKHLRDIAGIVKVSRELIDDEYLSHQASQLGVQDIWLSIKDSLQK